MVHDASRIGGLALSATLTVGTLGGCATTTRNATLIYPPIPASQDVAVAQAATPPIPKAITIGVPTLLDRRPDTTKVGNVRNGFGMKLAPIRTASAVSPWVRHALVVELGKAGYVADTTAPRTDSSWTIQGEILKVEADAYLSYGGEVALLIHLTHGDRELINQFYVGKGTGGTNWGATATSYAQALALALADALRQVVADVERATAPD